MEPERWRQIEDIFQEALDCAPNERSHFINEKCSGDDELRAEVEKLVARYETEEGFLESPVWTDSQFLQSEAKREIAQALDDEILLDKKAQSFVGERIGVYRLTEELGRGGMGVVFLAERTDGEFEQKVAVKLIKRGMDTDFIVKRFRFERQILANLNHPNIARLLDGGTTENGAPYFIMEFVEGEPVLKYCQTKKLGLREKLELFRQVCSAIIYAHRRGIVHRDIKPGNVLVAEDGAPKLLDFGIAKILDPDSIHESIAPTATAMRLMTPEYASPEQARGEEITPASDQYSLGVLLYELITGARPYKFPSRAPHEIARVICEQIPSEPSSGDFGKIFAGAEFSSDPDFCKKLDRIVLKALRKNPSERYASVEDFAADINSFLRNETIRAESFASEVEKIAFPPAPSIKDSKETLVAAGASMNNDTAAAPLIGGQKEKTISPRGRGVRQGLFLIILALLSIPIFTALIVATEIPPILQFFIFVVLLFVGIIRVVYALLLETGRKQLIAPPGVIVDSAAVSSAVDSSSAARRRPNDEAKANFTVARTIAEKKSIAVLPLKNLNTFSGENTGGSEFLNVGLADALITRLSGIGSLAVRPTSAVLRFAAEDSDSFAAGRELNVNFIVDGNIIKTGDRIRVSVQLLNVAEKSTVWAERFDEDYTDVLSLEDSISRRVAGSLVPRLSTVEARNLAKRATDKPDAYEAYLRGRAAWSTFSGSGLREANSFYQKAIELDPRYALAHAAIADYHIWLGIYGGAPPGQTYPAAKAAARRAIELDDKLAEAYAALGLAQIYSDFDWETGEANMLRALELNANNSTAHLWRSHPLLARQDFDEAFKHIKRSIELDPTSFPAQIMLAYAYYFAKRFEDAVSVGGNILTKFPAYSYAFLSQSSFLRAAGRYDEAIECARRALVLSKDSLFVTLIYAQTLAAAGKKNEAENVLSEIESQTADKFFSYYLIAIVHCYLKEKDRAFAALEKAVDKQDGLLIWVGNEPSFDFLRADARYQSLLEKINHPLAASAEAAPNTAGQNRTTFSEAETALQPQRALLRRSLPSALKYFLGAIVAVVLSFSVYHIFSHTKIDFSATPPSQRWKNNFAATMNLKRLTSSGRDRLAAISPDGKQVAFVSEKDEKESLLIRQIDSENPVQLVAPEAVLFIGLRFSPDGKYVYYTSVNRSYTQRFLWRVSTDRASTAPQKILENVNSGIGIAPDGNRLAYLNYDANTKLMNLLVAELTADGALQSLKTVGTRLQPDYFIGDPAFAPDGNKIAYAAAVVAAQKETVNLFALNLETGAEEKIVARDFNDITAVEWRENGEELVISANEKNTDPMQLWLISRPTSEITRLTNDLNNYHGVSLAKNSDALITVQRATTSNVAIVDWNAGKTFVNLLADGVNRQDGIEGVRWTADNRILYISSAGGRNSIVLTNADGSNSRIIDLGDALPSNPLLTNDGRYLFFVDEKGQHSKLRRYEMATGALSDVTPNFVMTPTLTPDDKFIVYTTFNRERKTTLHRVAVAGGGETELTNVRAFGSVVSPDNKFIACYFTSDKGEGWHIGIFPVAGGAPVRTINPSDTVNFQSLLARPLAWSADSRRIYYLNDKGGISNIFRIAADGTNKTEQITKFPSGLIFDFSISPDEKRAVVARGSVTNDVVIFKNSP